MTKGCFIKYASLQKTRGASLRPVLTSSLRVMVKVLCRCISGEFVYPPDALEMGGSQLPKPQVKWKNGMCPAPVSSFALQTALTVTVSVLLSRPPLEQSANRHRKAALWAGSHVWKSARMVCGSRNASSRTGHGHASGSLQTKSSVRVPCVWDREE